MNQIPSAKIQFSPEDRAWIADRIQEVLASGQLFSDAMGRPGSYEGTYLGMIDHNVTTIVRALGGEAPARGLNGKLTPPGKHP